MKTCQSTGYFQQARLILLLCLVSTFVFAASAFALTGNQIDQCYDCHGSANDIRPLDTASASVVSYRNITTGAVKGSHRTHVTNMPATTVTSTCTPCHGTPPGPLPAGTDHRNGQIDMNPAVAYTKSPFFNQTSVPVLGTCTTASCHGNPYGTGSVISPTWGTVSGCAACHNSTSGAAAAFDPTYGAPTTGAHNLHLAGAVTCGTCHVNVAKDTNTSGVHIDGSINVTGYVAPVAKHSIGSGFASCSATTCHGATSPSWGNVTTNATCTKCHGSTGITSVTAANRYVVAPPNSVSGAAGTLTGTGQVSNNTKVGAHQTHLQFFNGFTNYSTVDFRCENCHGPITSLTGTHANGSSVPAFQGLATRGGRVPTWTPATFTCTNTYCHNPAGATLNAANNGTRVFVSWTASSYLGDTRKTELNCNRCHKSPGAVAGSIVVAGTDHSTLTIASDCAGCHEHNGDAAGSKGRRHMDGIKYGGGGTACNGCHSYDAGDWASSTHNYGGTAGREGIGAHAKHITYIKTRFGLTLNPTTDFATGYSAGNAAAVCGVCHSTVLGDHQSGGRNINFNGATARWFGSTGTPATWYQGVSTTSSAINAKKCSNIDCHYGLTPLWSTY